jgi:hypothetical protein
MDRPTCPKCGATAGVGAKACPKCGTAFKRRWFGCGVWGLLALLCLVILAVIFVVVVQRQGPRAGSGARPGMEAGAGATKQ